MLRIPATERPDLERVAKEHNFQFQANGGVPFWDESIYYQFTLKQIEEDIEGPAEELEHLCFELIDRAMNDETVFRCLGIEECFWDYIAESWRNGEKIFMDEWTSPMTEKGPQNFWSIMLIRQRPFTNHPFFNGSGWNKPWRRA